MSEALRQGSTYELPHSTVTRELRPKVHPYAPAVLVSLGIILLLWLSKSQDVTWLDAVLAAMIIFVPAATYANWRTRARTEEDPVVVPTVFVVTVAFALNFGAGLFWSSRSVNTVDNTLCVITPLTITLLMISVLIALAAIYFGLKSRISNALVWRKTLELKTGPTTWNYIRIVLVVTTLLAARESAHQLVGGGGRALILTLQNDAPNLAFGLLLRNYLRGEGSKLDLWLLIGCTAINAVSALSAGWVGPLIHFALMCLIIYTWELKKLPMAVIAVVLAYVLFLQPGKETFRSEYWYGQRGGSKIERVSFWLNASIERWSNVLNGKSQETIGDLLGNTTERTSLIALTGQVYEYTPSIVPFQRGATYVGLLYSVIPRVIWPDKPSVSEVNHFYQTSYRLTREENLDDVSIAPGLIGEAYMNFSWFGVVFIFLLLGILFGYIQRQLGSVSSGPILNMFAILITTHFTLIESHMGSYLGNLPQQLLVLGLLLAPVISIRDRASGHTATPANADPLPYSADGPQQVVAAGNG